MTHKKTVFGLVMACLTVTGCGGGGGATGNTSSIQPVVTSLAVGALDGKWSCPTGTATVGQITSGAGDTIQIVGAQYYAYLGASPQALSYNKGIITGPDTAHYGGNGTLGQQLIDDRIYKVIHLADKVGFAGIYSTQDAPIGRGREFNLNSAGALVVTDYSVQFLIGAVYTDASGKAADLKVTSTTCTKV